MEMKNHAANGERERVRGREEKVVSRVGRWRKADVHAARHAQLGVVIELVTPTDCTHE